MIHKNIFTVLLNLMLLFVIPLSAQQETQSINVNMLNYAELQDYLSLNAEQKKNIEPLVTDIKSIIAQDEKAIQEMRSKMQSMGMRDPSQREKMMNERSERQNKIDAAIKEIEKNLNEEQLKKFQSIDKPNLLSKKMGRSSK